MANHLAECIHFPSQTALDKFASKFGCPLQHVAWTRQGGGHNADQISQPTLAILLGIAIGRIRPARERQGSTMHLFPADSLSASGSGASGRKGER